VLRTRGLRFDMIKKNVSSYILASLLLVAVMVLPDWALGQKTPAA
jgi:hypothetical protein